ncbi:MAG: tetratricopeptide repeat protein [Pseudomonadota bacterium]|nr:tetratricopeptide repeat protein [Pseudomonadota bacterium]
MAAATAAVILASGYGYVVAARNDAALTLPAGAGIPALEAATRARPDDAGLWKRLARAYRQDGRADDAVAAYVAAARVAPDDAEINAALRDLVANRR